MIHSTVIKVSLLLSLCLAGSLQANILDSSALNRPQFTLEANFSHVFLPKQTASDYENYTKKTLTAAERSFEGNAMIDPKYFQQLGRISYKDQNGSNVQINDVTFIPRGMRRRQSCKFKPLKISFPKSMKNPLFKFKKRRVKIVSHCDIGKKSAFYTEYFIYRALEAFGANAYRARLVNFTYIDNSKGITTETHPAFFLEPKKQLLKRIGAVNFKLTDAEKDFAQTPITNAEQTKLSWVKRYGNYKFRTMVLKLRKHAKYSLQKLENEKNGTRLPVAQAIKEALALDFRLPSDHLKDIYLNTFAVKFANGSTSFIDYDFDSNLWKEPTFDKTQLESVLTTLFQASISQLKARADIEQIKKEVINELKSVVASFEKSKFLQEVRNFPNPKNDHELKSALDMIPVDEMEQTIDRIKFMIANPDDTFSFLK